MIEKITPEFTREYAERRDVLMYPFEMNVLKMRIDEDSNGVITIGNLDDVIARLNQMFRTNEDSRRTDIPRVVEFRISAIGREGRGPRFTPRKTTT